MADPGLSIPALSIGVMTSEEVDTTVDWAAGEGWNPGLVDATCFRAADRGGFLAARADAGGSAGRSSGSSGPTMIGSISLVRYGPTFGFLGLYIVAPAWRGRGIGSRLWSAALELREGRVVGLDGVVAMQHGYARSGFVLAHRSIRYGGVPTRARMGSAHGASVLDVADLDASDVDDVLRYDGACFGAARPGFLRAWLGQPRALTAGVRDTAGLQGYGTIRPCRVGWKVGPLFADDVDVAAALLARLLQHARAADGAEVFLDVPQPHRAAVELASGLGLTPRFETARMYLGGDPGLPLDRVFGITSFELG